MAIMNFQGLHTFAVWILYSWKKFINTFSSEILKQAIVIVPNNFLNTPQYFFKMLTVWVHTKKVISAKLIISNVMGISTEMNPLKMRDVWVVILFRKFDQDFPNSVLTTLILLNYIKMVIFAWKHYTCMCVLAYVHGMYVSTYILQ